MNETQVKNALDNDVAKIAEKYAPENGRRGGISGVTRPHVRELADLQSHAGLTVANMRLVIRARIMEAAVTQGLAARNSIAFSAEDMERIEAAERQIFAIGGT